jgi:hypothetical protein
MQWSTFGEYITKEANMIGHGNNQMGGLFNMLLQQFLDQKDGNLEEKMTKQ